MQGELPAHKPGESLESFDIADKEDDESAEKKPSRRVPPLYKKYVESSEPIASAQTSTKRLVRNPSEGSKANARKQAEVAFYLRHKRKPEPGEDLSQ